MPKINLTNNEIIYVSNETAEHVNSEWNKWLADKKTGPKSVIIDSQSILMSRLKGVEFDAVKEIDRYDLNNFEHKMIIKKFEKEIGDKNIKDYMIEKSAWAKSTRYPEGAVKDTKMYMILTRKYSALHELRFLREKAKKHEIEHLEKMVMIMLTE